MMNLRFALLLVFLWITVGRTDPGPDEEAFLTVPGAESINPSLDADPVLHTIPTDLHELLPHHGWDGNGMSAPKVYYGFVVDLKQEGKNAYFIEDPAMSGSGGTGYIGFYKFSEGWRDIAEFQGPLYRYPSKTGTWPILVYIERGGGGIWAKSYMKFSNRKYQDIAIEHYNRGVIVWEKPAAN
jgi:hypothetical protein